MLIVIEGQESIGLGRAAQSIQSTITYVCLAGFWSRFPHFLEAAFSATAD
jgi:hypothetical protein